LYLRIAVRVGTGTNNFSFVHRVGVVLVGMKACVAADSDLSRLGVPT
jgi:hypothetical protein